MHSLFIASCNSLCILLISENVLVLTKYACAEIWKSKKNTFLGANEVPSPNKGGVHFVSRALRSIKYRAFITTSFGCLFEPL